MNQRLDVYDYFPDGMTDYLSIYGWHFSKKMCEWAVSKMKAENTATNFSKLKDELQGISQKIEAKSRKIYVEDIEPIE